MHTPVPTTEVQQIAPETFLIPNLSPADDGLFVMVNSMVIRGAEPVIVDTGAPVHHDSWMEKVFSIVEPEDVRWIFLSHDDGDHTGGLMRVLEMCPQATLITNFFSVERLALENKDVPFDRQRWLDPGESLHIGDRTLRLFKPPIYDGPTTRGVYDDSTAAMRAVDSFACFVPEGAYHFQDVPRDVVDELMPGMNSLISPWHAWLDADVYNRHVDTVESLGLLAVASAHGPILTGDAIPEAFQIVRSLAGKDVIPGPGPEVLEQLVLATAA